MFPANDIHISLCHVTSYSVLRLEDRLRDHDAYFKAAKDVIEVNLLVFNSIFYLMPVCFQLYIFLHDNPDAKHSNSSNDKPKENEDSKSFITCNRSIGFIIIIITYNSHLVFKIP